MAESPPRSTRVVTTDRAERPLLRQFVDVIADAPLFALAPLFRRRHLRWGATDGELAAILPGDDIVPDPDFNTTRAITINAPPELVWALIVQLGYGRAGWYSYDLLDNAGRPSSEGILPAYQQPAVGDWVPMAAEVNDTTAFRVAGFEAPRWLLWEKPNSTWSWRLVALGRRRTRLITRLHDRYDWRRAPANAVLSVILFEFGDFAMMRRLLLGIRRRAERLAEEAASPAE